MRSRVWPMSAAVLAWVAACGGDAGGGTNPNTNIDATATQTSSAPATGTTQTAGASGAAPTVTSPKPNASAAGQSAANNPPTTTAASNPAATASSTPAAMSGSAGTPATSASAGTTAAAAGSQASAGAAAMSGDPVSTEPTLPAIMDPAMPGPFDSRYIVTAPGLNSHGLFVPSEQGTNGKNPVVVWTCGNGGTISFYQGFLDHLASHGFFIVADKGSSSDRMAEVQSQNDAIAWVLEQNMSGEYSGKLDVDHIAVMGHSLGSLASFATAAMNEHVATSVHYSGGLTGNPVGFDMSWLASMTKPAAFLCGANDTTAGPACADDFDTAPPMLPVFYATLRGADHLGPFATAPRGGEYGRAGVAWLRWKLANDTTFKPWFTGTDCMLCSGNWTGMQRNLD